MRLQPNEHELLGKWVFEGGKTLADAVCSRIEWLTSQHLKKIATSTTWGDWEVLFQDPDDGRYWERTFPQSELSGGGPPRLVAIDRELARTKYNIEAKPKVSGL